MNARKLLPTALLMWAPLLAACVPEPAPGLVVREATRAAIADAIRPACPGPLKPETLLWLADKVEAGGGSKDLAAGNDIDRIDREAAICRGKKA